MQEQMKDEKRPEYFSEEPSDLTHNPKNFKESVLFLFLTILIFATLIFVAGRFYF